PRIEAANEAGHVGHGLRPEPELKRRADHDDAVADDDGGTAPDGRHLVEAIAAKLAFEVDAPALSEGLDRTARARVERHEHEPRRHDDDAGVLAVGPVGDAASRIAPRRPRTALALV